MGISFCRLGALCDSFERRILWQGRCTRHNIRDDSIGYVPIRNRNMWLPSIKVANGHADDFRALMLSKHCKQLLVCSDFYMGFIGKVEQFDNIIVAFRV